METVTIPKAEFDQMKKEIETLRNSKHYKKLLKRLAECKENIAKDRAYTREDLGF